MKAGLNCFTKILLPRSSEGARRGEERYCSHVLYLLFTLSFVLSCLLLCREHHKTLTYSLFTIGKEWRDFAEKATEENKMNMNWRCSLLPKNILFFFFCCVKHFLDQDLRNIFYSKASLGLCLCGPTCLLAAFFISRVRLTKMDESQSLLRGKSEKWGSFFWIYFCHI